MSRDEIQEKVLLIVEEYNAVNKAGGYKASINVMTVYFFDLLKMIQILQENHDGQRQIDLGQERDQGASKPRSEQ